MMFFARKGMDMDCFMDILACALWGASLLCGFIFLISLTNGFSTHSKVLLMISVICCLFGYMDYSEYGVNHIKNEFIATATEDNMKAIWNRTSNINEINNITILNNKDFGRHLNANIDHVVGMDLIRKNNNDSLVRIDYIESNGHNISYHKDISFISNHDIKKIKHDLRFHQINLDDLPDKNWTVTPDIENKTPLNDDEIKRIKKLL